MGASIAKAKSVLDDAAYAARLVRRRVRVDGGGFRVYSWHPRPWKYDLLPPANWMHDRLRPGHVVLDIGANRGYITLSLASLHRSATFHCFEPNPVTMRKLSANLRLNGLLGGRARTHDVALGEGDGKADFFAANSDTYSSLEARNASQGILGMRATFPVRVRSLDSMVESAELPPPDHVKVDVEGHEASVLRGMRSTLERRRPFLYVELHRTVGEETTEGPVRAELDRVGYEVKDRQVLFASAQGIQLLCEPR